MKGAAAAVEALAEAGVSFLAGIIGSSVEDIIEASAGDARLRYIGVRHEQAAASICDGYAKVARKPMACIAHAGPGACNLLVGVASAHRDSVPMLVITGNTGSRRIGRDAWHELDVQSILRPVTKHSVRVKRADDIATELRRAVALSMEGRPGPVHVDIPQDFSAAEVNAPSRSAREPVRQPTQPDAGSIERIARKLLEAQKPLIFAGGGVYWSGAWEALQRLARQLGAPVVVTETARGVLPEDDPLCLGVAGFFGNAGANRAVKEADVILAIGCRFSETSTFGWSSIPAATPVCHIDIDPRELGRQLPAHIALAADARSAVDALSIALPAKHRAAPALGTWVAELQAIRAAERAAFFAKATDAMPLRPQRITLEVEVLAGRDSVIAVGQGNHSSFGMKVPVYAPGSFLQSAGLGSLGIALPAALGAKLAAPYRKVFCFTGDGDLGTVMQELETAARESIGVTVIVFNNGGFGVNRLNQAARKMAPFGVDFHDTDFAALARVLGVPAFRVETPQQLRLALEQACATDGPTLVDAVIDRTERAGMNPKAVGLYT